MNKRIFAAAALGAGLLVQTQGFTQVPVNPSTSASTAANVATMSDAEKAARTTWHAVIRNTPLPGKGCFHVKYPNVAWESVGCEEVKPGAHPLRANQTIGTAPGAGNGTDYVAQSQGLISSAAGKFFISGVTSETNVNTANTFFYNPNVNPKSLIVGSNEYSLQLNTNNLCGPTTPAEYCVTITTTTPTGTTSQTYIRTAACGDYIDCHVWQQFMYATDYNCYEGQVWSPCNKGALFMQYWLYNWDTGDPNARCPKSYMGQGQYPNNLGGPPLQPGSICYKNSGTPTGIPDIPVADLGDVILFASAPIGGEDGIALEYGDDSWAETAEDSSLARNPGLDIATVWNQAEFNIVGDMNYSEAQFNDGAQITVLLAITDGSQSPPTCPNNVGTTGEVNNMTLGACVTGVGTEINYWGCGNQTNCVGGSITSPYIEFSESDPYVCLACGPVVGGRPPPIKR